MLPLAMARAAGGLPADSTRDESRSQTLAGSKVVSRQHPQPTPNQVPGGRSVRRQRCLIDGTRVPGRTPANAARHAKRAGGYVSAAQRQGHGSGARVPFIGNGMLYATTLPCSCGQPRGQSTVDAPILSLSAGGPHHQWAGPCSWREPKGRRHRAGRSLMRGPRVPVCACDSTPPKIGSG